MKFSSRSMKFSFLQIPRSMVSSSTRPHHSLQGVSIHGRIRIYCRACRPLQKSRWTASGTHCNRTGAEWCRGSQYSFCVGILHINIGCFQFDEQQRDSVDKADNIVAATVGVAVDFQPLTARKSLFSGFAKSITCARLVSVLPPDA